MKKNGLSTILAHYGENREEHNGAVVPPIYQNSLFTFKDWDAINAAFSNPLQNNIYTRGNNPSVRMVEAKIAKIAHGEKAKLFASGMAAITSSILHCVKAGDHIITLKNIYGPASKFIKEYLKEKMNIESTFLSGDIVEEFKDAIKENTTLIYLESPASVIFTVQDIEAITTLAKEHGIKTVIDNTLATPVFQKPLDMGIDLEVHSCSKYLGGHSDIISGVVIGKEQEIDDIFLNEHLLLGAKMAPFEAWLLMRSLRTLDIRMKQHQYNAIKIAEFLENNTKVIEVKYVGLPSFKGHELAKQQMSGFTGLMSFELNTEDINKIKSFVNALKYFSIGVSWGGHESLVHAPVSTAHMRNMTREELKELGLSRGTIRISVGLEDVDDLISDLEEALKSI